jgi:hypothetical protein
MLAITQAEEEAGDWRLVRVVVYTQRPQVSESDPADSYLLDVPFQRAAVAAFGQAEQNASN